MEDNINWWQPKMGDAELGFLRTVLENNFPNEGEMTRQFEDEVAANVGVEHAVAVTSGTAAIFLSLKALGVGRGDEVIVPDLTFIATANAVDLCGAKPVLIDVDSDTLNISAEAVKAAITSKTKVVIPVHVSGRHADIKAIVEVAGAKGVEVVEDAAEGFMSNAGGGYMGTFGALGCLSFSPNKIITTGQGGMVLTDDDKLVVRLRELKDQGRPMRGTGGADIHSTIGYNFKFTDLQAAVGLGQLTYLDERMERMRSINTLYHKCLNNVDGLRLFESNLSSGELPLWVDAIVEERDRLETHLASVGIGCRRFWYPIHTQKPYGSADKRFPVSTRLSPKALWLPSAFTLTDDDIRRVCERIWGLLG
jgi:perosamine synthetase